MAFLRTLTLNRWKLVFAIALVALSGALYLLQWAIFDNGRGTLFYLLQDVAFLPISILVFTIVVAEAIAWRDRESLLHKLNMVIGVFFSDLGNDLLHTLTQFDPAAGELCGPLSISEGWTKADFAGARGYLQQRQTRCEARRGDLTGLSDLLALHRAFLLQLVENPSLLEHQSFTELMWAVVHVNEEFSARGGLDGLEEADLDHLSGDITRAYRMLVSQWLDFMEHLSVDYPYLYSLSVRTSPLAQVICPVPDGVGSPDA